MENLPSIFDPEERKDPGDQLVAITLFSRECSNCNQRIQEIKDMEANNPEAIFVEDVTGFFDTQKVFKIIYIKDQDTSWTDYFKNIIRDDTNDESNVFVFLFNNNDDNDDLMNICKELAGNFQIPMMKANIGNNPEAMETVNITEFPTFVLYKFGAEVGRTTSTNIEDLEELIQEKLYWKIEMRNGLFEFELLTFLLGFGDEINFVKYIIDYTCMIQSRNL